MKTRELLKLINEQDKILKLPRGRVVNFDILMNMICKHTIYENILFIIIYGSALIKKKPNDLDVMVIVNNDNKDINKGIVKEKSELEKYEVCVGFSEPYMQSGTPYPGGPIYEDRYKGEWNPITIDLKIKSLFKANQELAINREGDLKDTCVHNAVRHGFILASQVETYSTEEFFKITNINQNKIRESRWTRGKWIVS